MAHANKWNAVICSHGQAKPTQDSPASAFSQATEQGTITGPRSRENKEGCDYWESLCGDAGKPNSINKYWLHPWDSLELKFVISQINVNNSPSLSYFQDIIVETEILTTLKITGVGGRKKNTNQ